MVSAGLLILAVSPAAPYVLPFTVIARGDLAISTALMVTLAGISSFAAPLLLHFIFPFAASGSLSLVIDPVKMIGVLFIIQLIPLCIGLAIGQWRPGLSSKLVIPSGRLSKILNFLMISAIAFLQFRIIAGIRQDELFVMIILVIACMTTGWLTGWPGLKNRTSSSIITIMRNMGLGMGIATSSFPGSPVVTTILAYSVVAGIIALVFAFILRRINSA
jgi:BASS family bile acid:Na+ symporter